MQKVKVLLNVQLTLFILFFILSVPIASLSQRAFYIPGPVLIPLHDEKQQLYTSLGLGGGLDLNLSYAFANSFAVFTTGTFNKGTKRRTSLFGDRFNIYKDDYALTGGFGYFKNQKGTKVLETYIGYGIYKVDNYWYFKDALYSSVTITQARYKNFFWQFNFGKRLQDNEFGFATRISYSIYKDVSFFDTYDNVGYIKSKYENLKGLNLDPVIFFGYKLKQILLNVQAGASIPFSKSRVTQINTHTYPPDPVLITEYNTSEVLIAFIGRINIQYTFNFQKKIDI